MCDVCSKTEYVCRVSRGAQFSNVKAYCLDCLLETYPKSEVVSMKIGDTISKTKLIKMLTGKTQRMWSAEEKCFQDIALTTRYDGNVMTITDFKDTGHYQIIRGESDTEDEDVL